jgi:Domain of unknown function (DUF2828)
MAFVSAMNSAPLTKYGVKGSDVYTEAGVGDLRVALFQQLVRGISDATVTDTIHRAFKDPSATKTQLQDYAVMTFQTRDVRGGKGERDVFYAMLLALFNENPQAIAPLIRLIPEYGCWKDCWKLWERCSGTVHQAEIRNTIVDLAKWFYFEDLAKLQGKENLSLIGQWFNFKDLAKLERKESLSLLGKWLPREKSKFHELAVRFADVFHPEIVDSKGRLRMYRKNCAKLNAELKTTEVNMCGHTWAEIEPSAVPGRLLKIARKAFLNEIVERKGKPVRRGYTKNAAPKDNLRHPDDADRMACREHFQALTKKALSGEVTMKAADVVYPHELVAKHMFYHNHLSTDESDLLQAQWNAIRDKAAAESVGLQACVPMSDFSGSMSGVPLEVSMALGILISEINHPAFRGYLLGFDSTPSWIDLHDKPTLQSKVHHARRFAQGTSTDFQAACDLILRRLVEHKVPTADAPKDLIVFTDMGFDVACGAHQNGYYTGNSYSHNVKKQPWETQVQMIRRNFADHGYTAPRIVLWNLRAEYKDFHAKADEEGVVILSGWSPAVLKAIAKNGVQVKTPYEGLRELLDDTRYDKVRDAWSAAVPT